MSTFSGGLIFKLIFIFGLHVTLSRGLQTLYDASRSLYFVNSGLIDRPNSYWEGKRIIVCTSCLLRNGTITAFQAYLRDAGKSQSIYFQIWRVSSRMSPALLASSSASASSISSSTITSPGEDATNIYTLLFNKQYDPSVLGSKEGCESGVHTVVLRPEENVEVEDGDVIGVYIESGASLVWSFDDRMLERRPDEREFTIYDNYISSQSLKNYESRRFGNIQVASNISLGAIVDTSKDLTTKKNNVQTLLERQKCATALATEEAPSTSSQGEAASTADQRAYDWSPSATFKKLLQVPSVAIAVTTPPPLSDMESNDTFFLDPREGVVTIGNGLEKRNGSQAGSHRRIYLMDSVRVKHGLVLAFSAYFTRAGVDGKGVRFQVWRRKQFREKKNLFELIAEKAYVPVKEGPVTLYLTPSERFNVSDFDYLGFMNEPDDNMIAYDPVSGDPAFALMYYVLYDQRQQISVGESYQFDDLKLYRKYSLSVTVDTTYAEIIANERKLKSSSIKCKGCFVHSHAPPHLSPPSGASTALLSLQHPVGVADISNDNINLHLHHHRLVGGGGQQQQHQQPQPQGPNSNNNYYYNTYVRLPSPTPPSLRPRPTYYYYSRGLYQEVEFTPSYELIHLKTKHLRKKGLRQNPTPPGVSVPKKVVTPLFST